MCMRSPKPPTPAPAPIPAPPPAPVPEKKVKVDAKRKKSKKLSNQRMGTRALQVPMGMGKFGGSGLMVPGKAKK